MGIYSYLEEVSWRELIHTKPCTLIACKFNATKKAKGYWV